MKVTISEPTPVPEMPVMYLVVVPPDAISPEWGGILHVSMDDARFTQSNHVGSYILTIDPSAPSFEPGPLEWVSSTHNRMSVWAGGGVLSVVRYATGDEVSVPNTRTDIGNLIRALVTAYHAAPEGT